VVTQGDAHRAESLGAVGGEGGEDGTAANAEERDNTRATNGGEERALQCVSERYGYVGGMEIPERGRDAANGATAIRRQTGDAVMHTAAREVEEIHPVEELGWRKENGCAVDGLAKTRRCV
jgi:hypothetical protein